MKEVSSGLICGVCGKPYLTNSLSHYCSNKGSEGIVIDSQCHKGCPICLSGLLVISYTVVPQQLLLCLNPECPVYRIEKAQDKNTFYKIFWNNIHLASFTIRKGGKAGIIWSYCGLVRFHNLIKSIAKTYIKKKIK